MINGNTDNLVLNNGLFNCDAMAEVEQYCTYVDVLGNEVLNMGLLRFPMHHMRLYTNDDRGRLIGYSLDARRQSHELTTAALG